eukprot:863689-Prymnesium_polylepis.1
MKLLVLEPLPALPSLPLKLSSGRVGSAQEVSRWRSVPTWNIRSNITALCTHREAQRTRTAHSGTAPFQAPASPSRRQESRTSHPSGPASVPSGFITSRRG